MRIECPNEWKLTNIIHFGLAFKNETFMGSDQLSRGTSMNKTIKTVDRCTYGSMSDLTHE
jgi:hypothetical protein